MTKNIKRILPVIEAIGNGKLEMRIDPPSSNEIRLISETVNRMAENLQKTLISKDKLQILFNEKEQLLTEVNHRVKNNLQLITSLIGLKESHSDVKELSDIKHHVEAISLTHEMLQNSDEEYEIDIRYYLNVILENVFALTEGKISINKNMEIEKLKIEKAKILGLIINETATNTIKYSSYKEKQITYNFSLSKNENRGIVRISDNGNPIPDNIEMTNSRTLGLQLISMLVKQLKGEIKLTKKPFPEFYIEFPLD